MSWQRQRSFYHSRAVGLALQPVLAVSDQGRFYRPTNRGHFNPDPPWTPSCPPTPLKTYKKSCLRQCCTVSVHIRVFCPTFEVPVCLVSNWSFVIILFKFSQLLEVETRVDFSIVLHWLSRVTWPNASYFCLQYLPRIPVSTVSVLMLMIFFLLALNLFVFILIWLVVCCHFLV